MVRPQWTSAATPRPLRSPAPGGSQCQPTDTRVPALKCWPVRTSPALRTAADSQQRASHGGRTVVLTGRHPWRSGSRRWPRSSHRPLRSRTPPPSACGSEALRPLPRSRGRMMPDTRSASPGHAGLGPLPIQPTPVLHSGRLDWRRAPSLTQSGAQPPSRADPQCRCDRPSRTRQLLP